MTDEKPVFAGFTKEGKTQILQTAAYKPVWLWAHLSVNEEIIPVISSPLIHVFHNTLLTSLHDIASQTEIGNDKFTSRVKIKMLRVAFLQHILIRVLKSFLSTC